jgi:hypothetical protein
MAVWGFSYVSWMDRVQRGGSPSLPYMVIFRGSSRV